MTRRRRTTRSGGVSNRTQKRIKIQHEQKKMPLSKNLFRKK